MVRGLYFHVTGTPLPVAAEVQSIQWDQFTRNISKAETYEMRRAMASLPKTKIGDSYEFSWELITDVPHGSCWWLRFYGRYDFIAVTLPPEETETATSPGQP